MRPEKMSDLSCLCQERGPQNPKVDENFTIQTRDVAHLFVALPKASCRANLFCDIEGPTGEQSNRH